MNEEWLMFNEAGNIEILKPSLYKNDMSFTSALESLLAGGAVMCGETHNTTLLLFHYIIMFINRHFIKPITGENFVQTLARKTPGRNHFVLVITKFWEHY